jgi:hypothetical protein
LPLILPEEINADHELITGTAGTYWNSNMDGDGTFSNSKISWSEILILLITNIRSITIKMQICTLTLPRQDGHHFVCAGATGTAAIRTFVLIQP